MPHTDAPIAPHDWFRPRLEALLAEARHQGYALDLSQAVITDLVNGELAADTPIAPSGENWARDIGEPAESAQEMKLPNSLPPETGTNDPRPDMPHNGWV